METISVKELADRQSETEIDLIDVRTQVEYREVHAKGANNHPLDSLDPKSISSSRSRHPEEAIYLICHTGTRSTRAVKKFMEEGVTNVVNVEGGTQAWEAAGLPVVRGKKAISLERQVRIAAGFLVLVGVALGFFVHPYFVGLSAFIGAGLMFAGITDTCGMGIMLAKMPWNQCDVSES